MSQNWSKLRWLGCFLLAAASCRSTPDLKPPKAPEDYRLPPNTDDRFSKPINYPKSKAEDDYFKAKQMDDLTTPGPGKGPGIMTPGINRPTY
jgi:hypothetical protein